MKINLSDVSMVILVLAAQEEETNFKLGNNRRRKAMLIFITYTSQPNFFKSK